MDIEFKELGLKIGTHGSGLCYELFEWQSGEGVVSRGRYAGQEKTAKWVSLGSYPSSIESAVFHIYELAILKNPKLVQDGKELIAALGEIRDTIVAAVPETVQHLTGEVR